ncbi:hypothetical protein CTAYLR_009439 [Chrysophaeum taylorii]|uniref:Gfo/Idh/MocA-like oxidoreductase N-terminal domain-containing protein n=1 Tax=Chrysophaeum taylorii TaxID=2483200 RepID=A0AAD7U8V0_9STRA|nr:hypothetical protein CTAYLR_009439 [Chrysophaeum taylorii]
MRLAIVGLTSPHGRGVADAAKRSEIVELVGVGGSSEEAVSRWCEEEGIDAKVKRYASCNAVLEDENVEAVYIGVASAARFAWCLAACSAGKHILVEKPIAVDMSQALSLRNAALGRVALMDATPFVHHARTRTMVAELRDERTFGRVERASVRISFHAAFLENAVDRAAADDEPLGCVGDVGWFAARWGLLAFGPDAVPRFARAAHARFTDSGVPLDLSGLVFFDDAMTEVLDLHCSFACAFRQDLEVCGARKRLRCDDFQIPVNGSKCNATFDLVTFSEIGDLDEVVVQATQTIPVDPDCQRLAMLDAFANLCRAGPADPKAKIWLDAAVQTQAIVSALLESARQGGKIVAASPRAPTTTTTNHITSFTTTATSRKRPRSASAEPRLDLLATTATTPPWGTDS